MVTYRCKEKSSDTPSAFAAACEFPRIDTPGKCMVFRQVAKNKTILMDLNALNGQESGEKIALSMAGRLAKELFMKTKLLVISSFLLFLLSFGVHAATVPVITPHPHDHDGAYNLSWSAATDASGISAYELQETTTTGAVIFSDGAEAGLGSWEVVGFSVTTEAASSGAYSFYSGAGDSIINTLTLKDPVSITGSEKLEFWAKYNIENSYDYLYVQVSTNKAAWTTIDSITGYKSSFIKKSYSLSPYAGQSLYVRFRYVTDYTVSYPGAYVDNIVINNGYDFTSLSNSLTLTSYVFSGKANGTYYYRVRAKNNLEQWGNFSQVANIEVGPDVYSPPAPSLSCGSSVAAIGNKLDLSWDEPSDESGIVAYEMQKAKGLPGAETIDDAESGLSKWTSSGFSISTKSHAGSASFFTGDSSNTTSTLTLKTQVYITKNSSISFWLSPGSPTAWYSGVLYLEVSEDGINWATVDCPYSYLGWEQQTCNLSLYAGKSVYLRFRYVTSYGTSFFGYCIDDVCLDGGGSAVWESLGDSLSLRSYTISEDDVGEYYFRIRAKDAAGNWSAFSSPLCLTVGYSSGADPSIDEASVTFSPEKCLAGDPLRVSFQAKNLGATDTTATVRLYYNSKDSSHFISSTSFSLAALSSKDVTFSLLTNSLGINPMLYFVIESTGSLDANLSNNEASGRAPIIQLVRPTFCYPNPFNPVSQSTKIVYELQQDTMIQIVMFDVAGRVIWRQTCHPGDEGGKAGLNEVEWNGATDFSETTRNGLYIYKVVQRGDNSVLFTGKVMVLQ